MGTHPQVFVGLCCSCEDFEDLTIWVASNTHEKSDSVSLFCRIMWLWSYFIDDDGGVCVCVYSTCRTVQWSVRVFSAHHLSAPLIQLQSTCLEHAVKSASVSIHTNKHKMRPCINRDAYISQLFISPLISSLHLFLSIISIFSSISFFPLKSFL